MIGLVSFTFLVLVLFLVLPVILVPIMAATTTGATYDYDDDFLTFLRVRTRSCAKYPRIT